MLLRTGLVSLSLLLLSRVLGLARDMAQAAVLGVSGAADVALLMLSLPDLLTGLLAAGALSYVLLPLWAGQGARQQASTQSRVAHWLVLGGVGVAVAIILWPDLLVRLLVPGLGPAMHHAAHKALWWSALAVPLAMLAALWVTRLQYVRDFVGMYGANLVVNIGLLGVLLWLGHPLHLPPSFLGWLGAGLLVTMVLRLLWLHWRLRRALPEPAAVLSVAQPQVVWPAASVWAWALASAGLPLALPLLARSLASTSGEGALATFNYAWKMVELPLVLLIQLVAALAFPAIAQAFAKGASNAEASASGPSAWKQPLRSALVLAWVLACACAAALVCAAPALAQLLFGWGRMPAEALVQVAAWSRAGAWSLLPQALLAVLLTLLASAGRLHSAVWVYVGALVLLATLASLLPSLDGLQVMWLVNGVLAVAAATLLVRERALLVGVFPWRNWLPPVLAAMLLVWGAPDATSTWQGLMMAIGAAGGVLVVSVIASPGLRQALRR